MSGAKRRYRRLIRGSVAALLVSAATAAYAQESLDPPPPQPDTTTVVEPVAGPDAPPVDPQPEPEQQGPRHVPESASEIDLSTLETRNFSLLYFDPVQTYLTPYLGRSVENAIAWAKPGPAAPPRRRLSRATPRRSRPSAATPISRRWR